MEIDFDPVKNHSNQRKHGVPLHWVTELDWSRSLVKVDDRHAYTEVREIAYGPIGDRLYCVVFTRRDTGLRVISLRKANQREFDQYVRQIEATDTRREPSH
jgi:uncharacterized DUF497 family protein